MAGTDAIRLATILTNRQQRIVLAESCTAGLAAARLAAVPGISQHLCGSLVTYRDECKQAWLGVPSDVLQRWTAVSAAVTAAMASGALQRTESADVAAAITGHLGPNAPRELDGKCFLAVAQRTHGQPNVISQREWDLVETDRETRQQSAADALLRWVADVLETSNVGGEP